ncbi:MAG: GspMb/PilO family protein [Candidatus Polarisedimenticolia bacterium]
MSRPRRRAIDLREDFWRLMGVLAALLALNLGFYAFVNLPRLRSLENLKSARDGTTQQLRSLMARRDAMQELIRRHDEEKLRLDDFYANRVGTQATRMTSIQKEIHRIAQEFRIDPESLDYSSTDFEGTDLVKFQVSIPLVGGYPNLRQFISRIERSDHLLIVEEVQLTGAREGGAMLSLTIKISTCFREPERPPLASAAADGPPRAGA